MPQERPHIPAELRRAVLVEAGHRCAIPTCRQQTVEIAHIVPWAKVQEHAFGNLIALCPTCHTRFDKKEIDTKAMLQYKANLAVLSSRYTQIEQQLLKAFVRRMQEMNKGFKRRGFPPYSLSEPGLIGFDNLRLDQEMWWLVSNLLDDGLVEFRKADLMLTEKGREFIQNWIFGEPIA